MESRLHHCAVKISRGSLAQILEVFEILGCGVVYRPPNNRTWAMVSQRGTNFNIQLVEYDEKLVDDLELKRGCHVAFVSNEPQKLIDKAKEWAEKNNLQFRAGGWSERELYFDFPNLFINFVVEIMHTSILED